MAVIDWSCTGIRVLSIIHGPLWRWALGRSVSASIGTKWGMMRSTADWLVPNSAASARVVRWCAGGRVPAAPWQPGAARAPGWQPLMGQGVDGVELIDVSPVSGRRFRQRRGIGWLSVACDCMSAMASAPADNVATTAVAMPRRRGKSKPPNFSYQGPVSVIRMELDATDEQVRRRVERQ